MISILTTGISNCFHLYPMWSFTIERDICTKTDSYKLNWHHLNFILSCSLYKNKKGIHNRQHLLVNVRCALFVKATSDLSLLYDWFSWNHLWHGDQCSITIVFHFQPKPSSPKKNGASSSPRKKKKESWISKKNNRGDVDKSDADPVPSVDAAASSNYKKSIFKNVS